MQKTLDILERNVQWIALGLGGIFLLWAAYSYVVTPPATVEINKAHVGAGDMSPRTEEGPAKAVQTAMNDNTGIQIPQLNVAQAFHQAMTAPGGVAVPMYAFGLSAKSSIINPGPGPGNVNNTRIAELPKLPPAQVVSAQTGLSVVNEPENNNAANPNLPNRNAVAVQPVVKTDDLAWVGGFWKISADQLKKAFQAPVAGRQMDPQLYNTTMLEVEVQRQQAQGVDANGQQIWPKDDQYEVVPAIKLYRQEVRKMPTESAAPAQKYDYADWAEKNPQFVYTPEFYQVSGGAPPPDLTAIYTPANGANNGAAGAGDTGASDNATQPAAPNVTTQPGAAPAGARQKGQPAGSQPSVRANPEPFYLLQDNTRPRNNYDSYYRRFEGRRPVPPPGPPGSPMRPLPPSVTGQGFNQAFAAGEGKIDPLNLQDDLRIWAYDDTAKPGQTYHYRIVYKMRNPVFSTTNVADPKLAGQLALVSPPSEWTPPVSVPEKTKFWIATLSGSKANLDVFQWEKGEWKKLPPKESGLTPGDQVPGTDWTVVDVRGEGGRERDKYVLLTNDTGQMSKRDYNTDHSDPTHKDLVDQANNPSGANGAGTTGTGGTAPPPPTSGGVLRNRFMNPRGR
jgi:hypothetical protein